MRGARVRNFYKVLGVATTADDRRIKKAFRHRAKAVHPDLNPGSRRAEARFIELMQAYKVLGGAETRAAYDAYLAERRSQSRRRLVHCAGLMMTSFVLTTASAIFVMSMAGANVPLRESWQLALGALAPANAKAPAAQQDSTGWTAQVAVAPASDRAAISDRVNAAADVKAEPGRVGKVEARPAATKTPGARGRETKEPRQQVATAPKQAPATAKRPEPPFSATEESWPPSPPTDSPRYSLGASDLR
jgi:curved DNA-binding protein CbpA